MVPSTAYLASSARALTPYVRLSHNTLQPCGSQDGLIRRTVKHYDTFITHRQQLCVSKSMVSHSNMCCSGRALPLLDNLLGYQIQHDPVSVRLQLLGWYIRNHLFNGPDSLNNALGCKPHAVCSTPWPRIGRRFASLICIAVQKLLGFTQS